MLSKGTTNEWKDEESVVDVRTGNYFRPIKERLFESNIDVNNLDPRAKTIPEASDKNHRLFSSRPPEIIEKPTRDNRERPPEIHFAPDWRDKRSAPRPFQTAITLPNVNVNAVVSTLAGSRICLPRIYPLRVGKESTRRNIPAPSYGS
ncbi:hypothetical protein GWI33_000258 [Rhynchophorus ferrugineus]|uniref:Uncharacterized protein n=1 Tax=Rhynchophorus ferrugineus TaxID=354439 RepID=A0A834MM79_RHYFE|nr:hypothetical protein GWI33_000258 [Rhynchophorus ferrugineus]